MLQKTELIEFCDGLGQRHRAEAAGPALVGEVEDPLAEERAEAGVVELALRREGAGVERRRRGDDLERRARDEAAGRRPVEERRGRLARRRDRPRSSRSRPRRGSGRRTATRRARARAPVAGSRATAAPHCPARPSTAARWASMSSVVTTSLPSRGIPRSLSRVVSITVLRLAFEPVRKSFIDSSRPVRERPIVE